MKTSKEELIRSLRFIETHIGHILQGNDPPESDRRFKLIVRTTLSRLNKFARIENIPELKSISDNIFILLNPKKKSRFKRWLYNFLGLIISVTIDTILDDSYSTTDVDLNNDDKELENEKNALKRVLRHTQSAIYILKNHQD
jgi:hypothetical protein